jgi:hypothetical protein
MRFERKRSVIYFFIIFYEFGRFLKLLGLFSALIAISKDAGTSSFALSLKWMPLPLYLAPLALFPIAAFFIWLEPLHRGVLTNLFISIKTLSVLAGALWVYNNIPLSMLRSALLNFNIKQVVMLMDIPLMLIFDIISILILARLKKCA